MTVKVTSRAVRYASARRLAVAAAVALLVLAFAPPRAAAQDATSADDGTMVDVDVDANRPAPAPETAPPPPASESVSVDADADMDAGVDARPDKSGYDLFNPTPRELMRPLSSDRPDVTETPYTVDAGHFQVELSFFEFARDEGGDVTEFDLLPFVAKVGLTNNVDLQLGVVPFVDVDVDGPRGFTGGDAGFGPVELRAKFNIWGNDGGGAPFDLPSRFPETMRERWGDSAFALMPYVRFPTGPEDAGFSNDVEFGVAAPLSTPITDEWDLGVMLDLGLVRGPEDGSYKPELLHTASFGRNLGGRLGGYAEYIGVLTGRGGASYLASIGVGLTYDLSPDARLDAAINVGINDEPEDFRFLTGITYRR